MNATLNLKIFAMLGQFNLSDATEASGVRRKIIERKVHKDFDGSIKNRKLSDADIAILTMESSVEFSNFIQPICLPSSSQNVVNVVGSVTGYGRIGFSLDAVKVPSYLQMRTIDLGTCALSYQGAFAILSPRTFCGGSPDGIPCRGKIKK